MNQTEQEAELDKSINHLSKEDQVFEKYGVKFESLTRDGVQQYRDATERYVDINDRSMGYAWYWSANKNCWRRYKILFTV